MDFRSRWRNRVRALAPALVLLAGCRTAPPAAPPTPRFSDRPAAPTAQSTGDEIVVAGRRYHTGTTVVTWLDRGGYNAYLPAPAKGAAPTRYGARQFPLKAGEKGPPRVLPPGLPALQSYVDQVVLHYDGSGLSRNCFNSLQQRGLSIHFMVDVDGTVYQTLDLQERALHATIANSRSIGIEIANVGAYPPHFTRVLDQWYAAGPDGLARLTPPPAAGEPHLRTPGFVAHPARPRPVPGEIQGQPLVQYDFTPQQYAALIRLTAALCRIFPRVKCDFPHDRAGRLVTRKLPDAEWAKYRGLLGHFHIQDNKIDPGPAFQWEALVTGARRRMEAEK